MGTPISIFRKAPVLNPEYVLYLVHPALASHDVFKNLVSSRLNVRELEKSLKQEVITQGMILGHTPVSRYLTGLYCLVHLLVGAVQLRAKPHRIALTQQEVTIRNAARARMGAKDLGGATQKTIMTMTDLS